MSLTNTRKKADTPVGGPGPVVSDSIALSRVPDKALVKYLQSVDDITSDLLRIVDKYAATGIPTEGPVFPDELPQGTPVTGSYAFIYFPASSAGEKRAEPGQVIVVPGGLLFSNAAQDVKGEEAIQALVKETARQLSAVAPGIGLKAEDIGSVPVRDRFIIFGETNDDVPVVSVIRSGTARRPELLSQDQVEEGGIQDVVTEVTAFLKEQVQIQQQKLPSQTHDVAGPASAAPPESNVTEPYPPSGPVKIVKEILSAVFSVPADENAAKNADPAESTGNPAAGGPVAWNSKLSDDLPGVTVRYINPPPPLPDVPAGTDPQALIVDKLAALKELVGGMPEPVLSSEGVSEEELAVVRETMRSVHEQVPALVRQALHAAARNYQGAGAAADQGSFGIDIDENGTLRIDRTVLTGSLSEKKEETVQFIRDFGGSLQDRLRYDFNPLAGVYALRQDAAGITEPGKKDRAGDDNDEQKARFEERLNKVQLLLRSSYELKDLFVEALSLNNAGPGDETDR